MSRADTPRPRPRPSRPPGHCQAARQGPSAHLLPSAVSLPSKPRSSRRKFASCRHGPPRTLLYAISSCRVRRVNVSEARGRKRSRRTMLAARASPARKGAPRAASDPAHWAPVSTPDRDGRARKEGAGVRAVLPTLIRWVINPCPRPVVHACVAPCERSPAFGPLPRDGAVGRGRCTPHLLSLTWAVAVPAAPPRARVQHPPTSVRLSAGPCPRLQKRHRQPRKPRRTPGRTCRCAKKG